MSMRTHVYIANSNLITRANMGLVESDSSIYIFDTTYDRLFFEKIIKSQSKKNKKLKLIISHKHKDHYGGFSSNMIDLFDRVIVGEDYSDQFGGDTKFEVMCEKRLVLEDGLELYLIINGHTEKDIVLHDVYSHVAFMGDLLLQNRHPYLSVRNNYAREDIYRKLLGWGIKRLVPGHGNIVSGCDLNIYLNYLAFVRVHQVKYSNYKNLNFRHILQYSDYKEWKYPENFERSIMEETLLSNLPDFVDVCDEIKTDLKY